MAEQSGDDPTRVPGRQPDDMGSYTPFASDPTSVPQKAPPQDATEAPTMPAAHQTARPVAPPPQDDSTRVLVESKDRPEGGGGPSKETATHVAVRTSAGAPSGDALIGRRMAGLLMKQKLGAGGMGAVYLARQLSLDRDVAVKVLPPNMTTNPDFVARFTREALTAAQLNHHNVVQVYDVGTEGMTNFISMEFVRGSNLGDMTRKGGKLAFEDAAAYVLQAARGLQYAHERGIVHRDIKPDNIMVNEHGIVKIADMGLAKIRGSIERSMGLDAGGADELKRMAYGDLTGASAAMGTPAYMAPEQGRDASRADHRADQYSLGCTLYYLVAGKTPFGGKTAFEIISKHLTEPIVPVDQIVQGVPRELSVIIEKMLAKAPEDRYQSMAEVIGALEGYLGIDEQKGPFTPREHHVKTLEDSARAYYSVPSLKMQKLARLGYLYGALGLFVIGLLLGSPFFAAAALGLLVLTPVLSFVVGGIVAPDFIFRRVRAVFFGMGLKGWGNVLLWSALTVLALWVFGLLLPWIVVAVLALGAAVAYQVVLAGKVRKERKPHIDATLELLKKLRINGLSEDQLQHFAAQYAGEQWEQFFEDLFGYEALIMERARLQRTEKVRPRKRHGVWRDPLARWLDEVEAKRRKRHEEKVLAKAEKQRLKAQGVTDEEAERQADEIAAQALSEGLLKETMVLAGPSRKEVEKAGLELHKSAGSRGKLLGVGYRFVRAVAGLAMGVVFAAPVIHKMGIPIPENIRNMMVPFLQFTEPRFYLAAAIAGALLFLTAFSSRVVLPTVVFLGAAIFAAMKLVVDLGGQPLFIVFWTGAIAAAGGFAMMVLSKVGGGKF